MSLGILRHARLFKVDRKKQMLTWEERPLWILGRTRRRCIPFDKLYVHLERVQIYRSTPVEVCWDELAWIRVRGEEPLLFMRTFGEDSFLNESPSYWADMLANDLGCPLTGHA